jgi:hypothetical protein
VKIPVEKRAPHKPLLLCGGFSFGITGVDGRPPELDPFGTRLGFLCCLQAAVTVAVVMVV